jgi:hypothetical protein
MLEWWTSNGASRAWNAKSLFVYIFRNTSVPKSGWNMVGPVFDVLQCSVSAWKEWFLVNDQRDAQFFTMYLFLFLLLTLYMFRAHRAHHQERQIVSTQPLVTVTLCRLPCRVQVGCELQFHRHRVTVTRGCVDTVCLSWWAWCARNM